ncbi:hypothetical protein PCH_Pc12g08550 [Penicillium rubens Wisconsin 54-1255]|uniref:Ricin B lectin domain-containing protein n=1 Tax=Penicillium rubens (strain ATCC 28089 / DSM 1075 / NRRL 1951 / Wisconsin 54-1255) TaxID=500485 RepID=B6GYA2_PENRW|nr:hypothetical protein PCH_Pc12g08550 [Penicillium rubens Wisconsin 54-1255]
MMNADVNANAGCSYISTTIDPGTWYRLTNAYLGTSIALDVENDGVGNTEGRLKMAPCGNYSGQFWQFIPQPSSGTYKICSMFLGQNRALDVYGNDKTKPHLATEGNYSGQLWTLDGWGDSTWRLSNAYSGNLRLDTYSDTHEPFISPVMKLCLSAGLGEVAGCVRN